MVDLRGSPLSTTGNAAKTDITGCVFNIERFAIRDGPGIRTTVFLKGCPLRCLWCANPESIVPHPQLLHMEHLCTRCYRCIDACPNKVNRVNADGAIEIDRSLCKACGNCVEACPNKARDIAGKTMTVDDVLEEVKKDALFYQNSGGGITASGGEPTQQPEFLRELFRRSQQSAIHTCLDTCGFAKPEILRGVLEHTDLVLLDIKHMDPESHRALTGVDNSLILDNARMIAGLGKPMMIRVPLIPGHNDSEQNLKALAEFMAELGVKHIDLLPYHSLGKDKYARLGLEYRLSELEPFEPDSVKAIKASLESLGLEVGVG
jgi:pyruvate formate lyase activating enzyme